MVQWWEEDKCDRGTKGALSRATSEVCTKSDRLEPEAQTPDEGRTQLTFPYFTAPLYTPEKQKQMETKEMQVLTRLWACVLDVGIAEAKRSSPAHSKSWAPI